MALIFLIFFRFEKTVRHHMCLSGGHKTLSNDRDIILLKCSLSSLSDRALAAMVFGLYPEIFIPDTPFPCWGNAINQSPIMSLYSYYMFYHIIVWNKAI